MFNNMHRRCAERTYSFAADRCSGMLRRPPRIARSCQWSVPEAAAGSPCGRHVAGARQHVLPDTVVSQPRRAAMPLSRRRARHGLDAYLAAWAPILRRRWDERHTGAQRSREGLSMKTSTERILTTHTGSLPRPAGLADRHDQDAVRAAVQETVARQLAAGVDIVNDGEVSKPSYATYVTERLSGFTGEPVPLQMRGFEEFPEFAQRMWGDPEMAAIMANPSCNGPVAYVSQSLAEADIANVRAAAGGATEVFMSAASPGVIEMFMANRYYPSTEEYLFALADAMKQEYDAIYQAGLVLQLDCPDLACEWRAGAGADHGGIPPRGGPAARSAQPRHPRHPAGPAADAPVLGELRGARTRPMSRWPTSSTWCWRPGPRRCRSRRPTPATSTNGRCSKRSSCPTARSLIPGVLDSTTNYIEHPELVAQRIDRATPAWSAGRTSSPAATAASPPSPASSRSTPRSPGRSWLRWPKEPGWRARNCGKQGPRSHRSSGPAGSRRRPETPAAQQRPGKRPAEPRHRRARAYASGTDRRT